MATDQKEQKWNSDSHQCDGSHLQESVTDRPKFGFWIYILFVKIYLFLSGGEMSFYFENFHRIVTLFFHFFLCFVFNRLKANKKWLMIKKKENVLNSLMIFIFEKEAYYFWLLLKDLRPLNLPCVFFLAIKYFYIFTSQSLKPLTSGGNSHP